MKKSIIGTLLGIALFLSVAAKAKEPHRMGIIGALDEEIQAIQRLMTGSEEVVINQYKIYKGTIHGKPVCLVKSGVGKANAAATTQLLLLQCHVREIIFTGVAGGVNPRNRIGDVVIARQLAQHDYGIVTPNGKQNWRAGTLFGSTKIDDTWFYLDRSALFQKLKQVSRTLQLPLVPGELAKTGAYSPKISVGTVVTGDEFVASEQKRKWLEATFQADAIEMEGAAFAQVCANNGVDCVVIRTISDLANEHSHVDFPKFAAYAASNSARLVKRLLEIY